jgi:hypothetical protein
MFDVMQWRFTGVCCTSMGEQTGYDGGVRGGYSVSNAELHRQLLQLYGVIEDHLKATQKIEEALGRLISLQPKLLEHIEPSRHQSPLSTDHNADTQPQTTDELLLRVHRVMGELGRQG